jgi:hypothetical protein
MTLLISLNDLKDRVDMPWATDEEDVKPLIISCQTANLKPMLCDDLYNELITQQGAGSFSAANALLMPYVVEYLCRQVYRRYVITSSVKATKSGLRQMGDTETQNISEATRSLIAKMAQEDSETAEASLKGYLIGNIDTYPLYRDSVCNKSDRRWGQNGEYSFSSVGYAKRKDKAIQSGRVNHNTDLDHEGDTDY